MVHEANVIVGAIVWAGDVVPSGNGNVSLHLHKATIGGAPATRCERDTVLSATFAPSVTGQTVPYHEVNCAGVSSSGSMRVASFAGNNQSFNGSFWQGSTKLGDFDAHKE